MAVWSRGRTAVVWVVVAGVVVLGLGGCGGSGRSAKTATRAPVTVAPAGSSPLLSDGWKPGDSSLLALTQGPFEAVETPAGPCAWLGLHRGFLWPAGYRVRFDPTELLAPDGHVVAREGDVLSTAGGEASVGRAQSRCTPPGGQTWVAQSTPKKA